MHDRAAQIRSRSSSRNVTGFADHSAHTLLSDGVKPGTVQRLVLRPRFVQVELRGTEVLGEVVRVSYARMMRLFDLVKRAWPRLSASAGGQARLFEIGDT
ncbi:hypothetical protein ACFO9E_05730 [Streptomyces maoxianensis]|uniref:Uncharacterized protein n=1 Tax=Streptomyces maoxianensis TaxID=1459942 RepID=A0ABV9FZT2_9ACTN